MKIILKDERSMSVNKVYSGMHWTKRKEEADRVHTLVFYAIPYKDRVIYQNRVDIFITCFFKNKPFDSDNIFGKIYVDGLKGVLIKDDHRNFVRWVGTRSEIDKENPRVEIEITESKEKVPSE